MLDAMGPMYPSYPSQPYRGGNLPTMEEVGPPDTRYSSGTAPIYESGIQQMYGRSLAGSDHEVQDEKAEPAWASNELTMYAQQDDVQGSGIFDPPGTHPNIHPDAGVFATNYSLPGYHARERPFSETEVRDVTTGRPVRAVPSGAVAFDSAAQIAFIEDNLYGAPQPIVNASYRAPMGTRSIANTMQNPLPVGELPVALNEWSLGKLLVGAVIAGGVLGAIVAVVRK